MKLFLFVYSILFVLTLINSGCGTGVDLGQIDPAFRPVVSQFESDSKTYGNEKHVNLWIHFVDLEDKDPGLVGQCVNGDEIQIDPKYWHLFDNSNGYQQKSLLYHELGHCVLGREHTSDTFKDISGEIIADSIMNPYVVPADKLKLNENHYLAELFNRQ